MEKQNKRLYCCDTTEQHPLAEKYSSCLVKIYDITERESNKKIHQIPFNEQVVWDLDAVEKAMKKGQNENTMDICFGISREGKAKQMVLCEYRLNFKSVSNISKTILDAKINHSKDLVGHEVPIYDDFIFIFSSDIKEVAKNTLRKFGSNKLIYIAMDIYDLKNEYFDFSKSYE